MEDLGIHGFEVSFVINESEKEKIKQQIEKEKEEVVIPKRMESTDKPKWQAKKKVEYQREGIVPISSITREENSVNLEAYVFDAEYNALTKKDGTPLYLATLKISDNTSSILAKTFARDEEEFAILGKNLKKGKWFHFTGQVRFDDYAKDLVFQMRDYEEIGNPEIKRVDDATEKRVELHSHTMMSQMDGVCDEVKLVKQAIAWGHAGIGITDHDCCQAFAHVFSEVTAYNKGKKKEFDAKIAENEHTIEELKESGKTEGIEELEKYIEELKEEKKNYKPFKAAYGVELEMCESYLNVCFNPTDDLIAGNTFVVFDTETTGFNPGLGDSMIEIGGVKVKDGEVIDRFDELINPGHHIDEQITRVTNISDDDVKDADNEENVTKRFKEWIGALPLVAHNARFDKNMLDMAYYKYDLGKLENPIIDTLMLSRIINRDQKKHSLKALGKLYGVDTGEETDEDEESNELPATAVKLDDETARELLSVKVDGEELIKSIDIEYTEAEISTEERVKKTKKEYYLNMVYKASKTESINLEVTLGEENELVDFSNKVTLHPAENIIEIKYTTAFGVKTVNASVYVGQHHGADVDSENTGYIFNKMLSQIEGIKTLNELNDLGLLESIALKNNPKYLTSVGELCTYKNYVRKLGEDEEAPEGTLFPFEKYGNKDYVWKFPWCKDNFLQMYENIPGKTFTEHSANMYDNLKHVTFIAKDKVGLKNLFKIISFANTNFIHRNAKIPRKLIEEYREGILVGSACLNGEIFYLAETRCDEDLIEAMKFYDYIEVQPIENYSHLLTDHSINNIDHLKKCIKKIIDCAKKCGKLIVATGDVHNIDEGDRLYREIIVNQNVPGKGRHPLAKYLSPFLKNNSNKENIKNAIEKAKKNGVDLSNIDIKVLKYVYALTSLNELPITSSLIASIYAIDKKSTDEEQMKKDDNEKKYIIDASLRKLQIGNLISVNYSDGTYSLISKHDKGDAIEEGHIPNQFFRTTNEMLSEFSWLNDDALTHEIVIENPNKIIDMLEEIEVVIYPDKPFSPIIENSQETCRDLVFERAWSMYGNPLPRNIEERIAQEFYGDKINALVLEKISLEHPELSDEEKD